VLRIHYVFVIVLLATHLAASPPAATKGGVLFGRPPVAQTDRNENLRESCRRLIGGQYLTRHDEALQARRYLQVLKDQEAKMKKVLASERQKLAQLDRAASVGEFDAAKATARDIQLGIVSNLEEQLAMNASYQEQAARTAELKTVAETMMRRRLAPVFKITELKGEKNQLGYSFRVDFNSTCPRYQFQCPLPESHQRALKEMLPEQELPVACQRYASIGAVKGSDGD